MEATLVSLDQINSLLNFSQACCFQIPCACFSKPCNRSLSVRCSVGIFCYWIGLKQWKSFRPRRTQKVTLLLNLFRVENLHERLMLANLVLVTCYEPCVVKSCKLSDLTVPGYSYDLFMCYFKIWWIVSWSLYDLFMCYFMFLVESNSNTGKRSMKFFKLSELTGPQLYSLVTRPRINTSRIFDLVSFILLSFIVFPMLFS